MTNTNHKELILKTYQKKKRDKVSWQPRIMLWYNGNYVNLKKKPKNLKETHLKVPWEDREKFVPSEWFGKSVVDIHDELDMSIRYTQETMGIGQFYYQRQKDAKVTHNTIHEDDGTIIHKTITPVGSVTTKRRGGFDFEKMVKTPEDLKVVKYLVETNDMFFNEFMFEAAEEELGNRGIPQTYYFRSPYQQCVLEWLGFERTTIWLKRKPKIMEDFLQFLLEKDEYNYKNVILPSKMQLLNFGENIDDNLSPPREFEKYLLPYYEERVKWCKNAPIPKYTHIHIDGHFKNLLPYIADIPMDGIEALTPQPQGDVELEEIRDAIGEKIVLDMIPATLFMPQFPEKRLIEDTKKILEYFPNLILGVSDELPGNADGRRLKIVSDIVEKFEY